MIVQGEFSKWIVRQFLFHIEYQLAPLIWESIATTSSGKNIINTFSLLATILLSVNCIFTFIIYFSFSSHDNGFTIFNTNKCRKYIYFMYIRIILVCCIRTKFYRPVRAVSSRRSVMESADLSVLGFIQTI